MEKQMDDSNKYRIYKTRLGPYAVLTPNNEVLGPFYSTDIARDEIDKHIRTQEENPV